MARPNRRWRTRQIDKKRNDVGEDDLPQLGQRMNAAQAGSTAGRVEVCEEDAHDFAKSEREDHHVNAANAKCRCADDDTGDRRSHSTGSKGDRKRNSEAW